MLHYLEFNFVDRINGPVGNSNSSIRMALFALLRKNVFKTKIVLIFVADFSLGKNKRTRANKFTMQ